jgi:hypothetical protein
MLPAMGSVGGRAYRGGSSTRDPTNESTSSRNFRATVSRSAWGKDWFGSDARETTRARRREGWEDDAHGDAGASARGAQADAMSCDAGDAIPDATDADRTSRRFGPGFISTNPIG